MTNYQNMTISLWATHEISLTGPATGNPFDDVTLSATFRQGDRTIEAPGFYDGDGTYRVRFLADATGNWDYETRSSEPTLNGQRGSIRIESRQPVKGDVPDAAQSAGSRAHGPVRVANQFHFAYADGTPYRPIGTTCYAWTHQGDQLEEKTLRTLASAPFNKLRMCVFPKHYDFNANEPELYPFETATARNGTTARWDFSRPNPAFFRHLESRIAALACLGIEADLILFHPYDRWGFSAMAPTDDDRYLRYVVARLAAYPNVWWSLANEYDILRDKTEDDWERFARIIQETDPWDHLRSIHQCVTLYDHSRPWITHCSLQRVDVYKTSENTAEWRARWGKPAVLDECGYEGNINWGWGNLTGEELTRRMWEGTVRGGYFGHGETYLNDREELWWSKGGELIGESPARIDFLRRILEDSPAAGLSPNPGGLSYWDVPVGGVEGEYYLFYFGFSRPAFRVIDLPGERAYRLDVIDTWNMTVTPLPGEHRKKARVSLPSRQFMAIRARAIN